MGLSYPMTEPATVPAGARYGNREISVALDRVGRGGQSAEDWDLLRWFARRASLSRARRVGIHNPLDLEEISETIALRFVAAVAEGRIS